MKAQSAARAIRMLRAVLEGKTYDDVAKEEGIVRSAVEQRVKLIDAELRASVGVEGAPRSGPISAKQMRQLKDAYLVAISRYTPKESERRTGQALSDAELEHAVAVTREHSNCAQRDVALLYIIFATAAKPLEIARLAVRDYLNADGSIKVESQVRMEVAFNGQSRPLYFVSERANAAVDAYLQERVRRRQGLGRSKEYRGLDPESRLFLTEDGREMRIRVREGDARKHNICHGILDIYRKIFRRAGLKGVSALSARRTAAGKLYERGCGLDNIGKILGLKLKSSVRELVPKKEGTLKEMVRGLL